MNKEMQKKYLELQLIDHQIKQIQKQIEMIESQLVELESVSQSLDEMGTVEPGTEILVPISGGVFVKAELKDNKELIVNVGAGTSVTKTIPETLKMIAVQTNEIVKAREELLVQLQIIVSKARKIQEELEKMQEEGK